MTRYRRRCYGNQSTAAAAAATSSLTTTVRYHHRRVKVAKDKYENYFFPGVASGRGGVAEDNCLPPV